MPVGPAHGVGGQLSEPVAPFAGHPHSIGRGMQIVTPLGPVALLDPVAPKPGHGPQRIAPPAVRAPCGSGHGAGPHLAAPTTQGQRSQGPLGPVAPAVAVAPRHGIGGQDRSTAAEPVAPVGRIRHVQTTPAPGTTPPVFKAGPPHQTGGPQRRRDRAPTSGHGCGRHHHCGAPVDPVAPLAPVAPRHETHSTRPWRLAATCDGFAPVVPRATQYAALVPGADWPATDAPRLLANAGIATTTTAATTATPTMRAGLITAPG